MENDHYATLGVSEDADLETIRKRYRALVRENHPDAVPSEKRDEAHSKMLALNAAWTVLSSSAERASYDVSRHSEAMRIALAEAKKMRAGAKPAPPGKGKATARPAARARSAASTRSARDGAASPSTSSNPRLRLLAMLREAEDLYFRHGLAAEAIALCERVRQFDPSSAEAAALLGDIYKEQGRRDLAAEMYAQAVKSQPNNEGYTRKLNQVGGAAPSEKPAGPSTRATSFGGAASASPFAKKQAAPAVTDDEVMAARRRFTRPTVQQRVAPEAEESTRNARLFKEELNRANTERSHQAGGLMMMALAVLVLVWGALGESDTAIAMIAPFSSRTMAATCVAAALAGGALPLLGMIERAGQVRPGTSKLLGAPLLLGVLLIGIVASPLAVPLFLLICAAARAFSKSMLIVLLMATLLACTMAFSVPDERILSALTVALLKWSGRAVLPFLLIGWVLGSIALGNPQRN